LKVEVGELFPHWFLWSHQKFHPSDLWPLTWHCFPTCTCLPPLKYSLPLWSKCLRHIIFKQNTTIMNGIRDFEYITEYREPTWETWKQTSYTEFKKLVVMCERLGIHGSLC